MKQVQRVLTLALAVLLVAVPVMAQSSTSPSTDVKKDSGTTQQQPSAAPATEPKKGDAAGQASPKTPMSLEECKDNGWQKLGFKDEAACTGAVKK